MKKFLLAILNILQAVAEALQKSKPVAPSAPTIPPASATTQLFGRMSTFGGPDDKGVMPSEGLALVSESNVKSLSNYFLAVQPPGTTGLARRLNPASYYIACRWDYAQTPKSFLRAKKVFVEANNKTLVAQPVDWGPNAKTGRIADLSPGLAHALGLHTDDLVRVTIPLPKATKTVIAPPSSYPSSHKDGVPPWLENAYELVGTKELSGGADNPVIIHWAQAISQKYPDLKGYVGWFDHDSIPWCGLFMAYCVAMAGYKPPQQALGAKNWFLHWPDGKQLDGPAVGSIMVKSRKGGGHVTMYLGESDTYYYCLGGNQSDQVNVAAIRKSADWLGFMWPRAYPMPTVGPVRRTFAEAKEATEA